MLKKCLPEQVQISLEVVVLSTMPWDTFKAHVIHYVEQYRKKHEETKVASEALLTLLYKTQLGEVVF